MPALEPEPVSQGAVPLPPTVSQKPVPLPVNDVVPLPKIEEPIIKVDERKESEKTDDAFSGAFSVMAPEPEPRPEPEPKPEPEPEPQPEPEPAPTLADAFAAADTDNSGGLSVQEIADATGMGIEEAEKIHAEADTDGDGEVTLEELKSQPAVTERMALPKPVKPIRAGIKNSPPQQSQQINQQQQAWLAQQQQQQQQQAWLAQQQQQQQGWGQPVQPMQPTIRSGIYCRGCRIGIDPNWRFCPVCGTQNR